MAEHTLYQHFDEPKFPIEDIAEKLEWLRQSIDAILIDNTDSRDRTQIFTTLIDAVLVFARARTSALHNMRQYEVCKSLTSRLNTVLQSIHATHHTIELVRY